ncbi:MAG: hypothetical protein K8U03_07100 [Planctomycetia bacterium]|nr:hypothetical protein [Planctomycetia bacterium]
MTPKNHLLVTLICGFGLSFGGDARAASPVEDAAEHFANMDRDGSPGLSKAEIGPYAWGRYDADDDGLVSKQEFIAGRNADRLRAAAAGRTDRAWSLLDWNHDDFLSGTELDGKWEQYDADANGRVTRQEFLGSAVPLKVPADMPMPGAPPAPADVVAVPAGKSLWGKTLAEAKQADLFTFFGLEPLEGSIELEAGTQFDFRPKAPAFRKLVLLHVIVDDKEKIRGAELLLERSFIESPQTGRFARDIAKSFLSQLTPDADLKQSTDLINEIMFGGEGNRVVVDPTTIPRLPNPPTPGYQVFQGKSERFDKKFEVSQLAMLNFGGDEKTLSLSIQRKNADEPGAE